MKRIHIQKPLLPTPHSVSDTAIVIAGVVNEQVAEIEKLQNEVKGLKQKLETQDKILEVEALERIELKQEISELKEQIEQLKELFITNCENKSIEQPPKYKSEIEIPPKK